MIISIRGTHGSGKSTIVRGLIDQFAEQRFYGRTGKGRPEAYALAIPGVNRTVYVLGPYETPCGGCDAVQPYDAILEMASEYGVRGHVVLEGALVSSSYGRLGRMMERLGAEGVMAFLDTPLEECIRRISLRRLERGDMRPLVTHNTESKYRGIQRSRQQVAEAGVLKSVDLMNATAVEQLVELLRGASDALPERLDYEAGRHSGSEAEGGSAALDQRSDHGQISLL